MQPEYAPAMTETEIRERLRTWIFERSGEHAADLRDDTPILERGILTSLDVVELVVLIEEMRGGREVSVETLEPAAIRDVNAIYRSFFVG